MRCAVNSLVLALAAVALGCTGLDSYEGTFRGGVVGSDDPECPPGENCSFIRRGFPEATVLRLDDFVPPPSDRPVGTLTTEAYDAFAGVPLETIGPLEHDQLSLYTFPGAGRIRNYIFIVRPEAGPIAGREGMVFVSLLDDNNLELRVVVGSGNERRNDHFGFFRLLRR